MAFDWEVFAKAIRRTAAGAVADISQREGEKRLDKRKIALMKEEQEIRLEGLSRRLDIEEPSKKAAEARLLENRRTLAEEADQRQRAFFEWQSQFNRGLDLFAGSEGFTKAIEKARKDGGLPQIAVIQLTDSIMQARAGEVVPLKNFEGLDPFSRLRVMDLVKQNNIRVEEHQEKMAEIQRNIVQNQELMDYRKRQEAARVQAEKLAREKEERMGIGQAQVMAKRWTDMRDDLDDRVIKSEKIVDDYRIKLMDDLENVTEAIDEKGRAKIPGKNLSLFDPDTGDIDEEVAAKLVKKYKRYRGRFKRLKELQENVKTQRDRRDEFFGGEPAGAPVEAEVPEEEIKAAMEMGLTREQAIEQYRKFLATKR